MKKLFLKEYDYGDKKKITVIVWSRDGASQFFDTFSHICSKSLAGEIFSGSF